MAAGEAKRLGSLEVDNQLERRDLARVGRRVTWQAPGTRPWTVG
jgi:hypothetical protein